MPRCTLPEYTPLYLPLDFRKFIRELCSPWRLFNFTGYWRCSRLILVRLTTSRDQSSSNARFRVPRPSLILYFFSLPLYWPGFINVIRIARTRIRQKIDTYPVLASATGSPGFGFERRAIKRTIHETRLMADECVSLARRLRRPRELQREEKTRRGREGSCALKKKGEEKTRKK